MLSIPGYHTTAMHISGLIERKQRRKKEHQYVDNNGWRRGLFCFLSLSAHCANLRRPPILLEAELPPDIHPEVTLRPATADGG